MCHTNNFPVWNSNPQHASVVRRPPKPLDNHTLIHTYGLFYFIEARNIGISVRNGKDIINNGDHREVSSSLTKNRELDIYIT